MNLLGSVQVLTLQVIMSYVELVVWLHKTNTHHGIKPRHGMKPLKVFPQGVETTAKPEYLNPGCKKVQLRTKKWPC